MTAANPLPQSHWTHYREAMLTALVSWVLLSVGQGLRRSLYREILARVGAAVEIQPEVGLINADCLDAAGIPAWVVRQRLVEDDIKLHSSELSAITVLISPP